LKRGWVKFQLWPYILGHAVKVLRDLWRFPRSTWLLAVDNARSERVVFPRGLPPFFCGEPFFGAFGFWGAASAVEEDPKGRPLTAGEETTPIIWRGKGD